MNKSLLNTKYQEFINKNLYSDLQNLALRKKLFPDISNATIIGQIESKLKSKYKLPTWFNTKHILYPKKISIEQSSSEITAKYKSSLVSGSSLLDLTSGFGVDDYYFSENMDVVGCEIDNELLEITKHNFSVFKKNKIEFHSRDGVKFLKDTEEKFSWIYIDPSRRDIEKNRVYKFKDCTPNIISIMPLAFEHTDNIMIKSSPLVDLKAGIDELVKVSEIHIVAINNDVKELLWILKYKPSTSINIHTINLKKDHNEFFKFKLEDEVQAKSIISLPLSYLYEPNAAILKSGAFKLIAERFNLFKLHQHSHLYTSEKNINFPGRKFEVIEAFLFNKKQLKKVLPSKANISIRNFPLSVNQIKKELRIKDGGLEYLFFTTNMAEEKMAILCRKAD